MVKATHAISTQKVFQMFCTAYFFVSAAEGFITALPLYLKEINGNEFDAGLLLFIAAISAVSIIYLIQRKIFSLNPALLSAMGCLFFICGALPIIFISHLNGLALCSGLFIGFSTGLAIISGGLFVAQISQNNQLNIRFSVIAGLGVLGYIVAPLVIWQLHSANISYQYALFIAIIISLCAGILFLVINKSQNGICINDDSFYSINTPYSIRIKIMFIFLTSFFTTCLFGSLINFQSSYALINHLNYEVFYIGYLITVLFARFVLVRYISEKYTELFLILSFVLLLIAFTLMTTLHVTTILYIFFSLLVGLSYGLTLPLLQTSLIVELSHQQRKYYLSQFCNIYIIAAFGFPVVTGWVITHYDYQMYLLFLNTISFLGIISATINYFLTSYHFNSIGIKGVSYE